ncbi:MAG: FHA domain-containing protein [Flavobacteriaceae bacterium]|nr:FHA domain-containing protein [Flavobacteriaceae bacterium]
MAIATYIVGRDPKISEGEIAIAINDPSKRVSKTHCRISFEGQHFSIEDLNSTNGTYVNGSKITDIISIDYDSSLSLGKNFSFSLNSLNIPDPEELSASNLNEEADFQKDYNGDANSPGAFEDSLPIEEENTPPNIIPVSIPIGSKLVVSESPPSYKKSKKSLNPVIMVVILLVIATLGGGGYYFANKNSTDSESEPTILLQSAENYFNLGDFRGAYGAYNSVLLQYPENNIAKKRVEELVAQSNSFQKRSVDSVMQLYLQITSLENFNPNDSILGYKLVNGFTHIYNELENLRIKPKVVGDATILDKVKNDLDKANCYFQEASNPNNQTRLAVGRDALGNGQSDAVSFSIIETPPIFPGCPPAEASSQKRCFENKITDYLKKRIQVKNYRYIALKSGIQQCNYSFVVGKDGSVKSVQVSAPHEKIENEIRLALMQLKGIKPGFQKYIPVEVVYNGYIAFEGRKSEDITEEEKNIVEEEPDTPSFQVRKIVSLESADQAPIYPGCEGKGNVPLLICTRDKIYDFINDRSKYNAIERSNTKMGQQRIVVNFNIERDGSISNIRVRTPMEVVKMEVEKVIASLPRMKPGYDKDELVIIKCSFTFILNI